MPVSRDATHTRPCFKGGYTYWTLLIEHSQRGKLSAKCEVPHTPQREKLTHYPYK